MKLEKSNIPDRMTGKEYQEFLTTGKLPGQSAKPSKLHNVRTEYAGRNYDSRSEAKIAQNYDLQQQSGSLIASIPQPSMPLTPKTSRRIRPDFLLIQEIYSDGTFRGEFVDVKGFDTPAGKKNRQLFKDHYGVDIRLVKVGRKSKRIVNV